MTTPDTITAAQLKSPLLDLFVYIRLTALHCDWWWGWFGEWQDI